MEMPWSPMRTMRTLFSRMRSYNSCRSSKVSICQAMCACPIMEWSGPSASIPMARMASSCDFEVSADMNTVPLAVLSMMVNPITLV